MKPRRAAPREKLLAKVLARKHRYHRFRAASQSVTLLVLYVIPLTGLARFDLWSGRHASLGRQAGAFEGLVATLVGILFLYLVTFLLNLVFGRIFCGWGCPIAQVSRLGEQLDLAARTAHGAVSARLRSVAFGLLLSGGVLLWWVHPLVFLQGSAAAILLVLAVLAALTSLTLLHGRRWRWAFCAKACPVGLYYSVVTMERTHGIVFEEAWKSCKDCHACDLVCPVSLAPRDLSLPRQDIGGLAIDGLPSLNHCLSCGDCVQACEHVFRREPDARVPLHFGFGRYGRPLAAPAPRSGANEPRERRAEAEGSAASLPGEEGDERGADPARVEPPEPLVTSRTEH